MMMNRRVGSHETAGRDEERSDGHEGGRERQALQFTHSLSLQHPVLVEMEAVDKGDRGSVCFPCFGRPNLSFLLLFLFWFVSSPLVCVLSCLGARTNLSVSLLAAGLADIVDFSADHSPHRDELFAAAEQAKAARKGIWIRWNEDANDEKKEEGPEEEKRTIGDLDLNASSPADSASSLSSSSSSQTQGRALMLLPTEIVDGATFYAQVQADPRMLALFDR